MDVPAGVGGCGCDDDHAGMGFVEAGEVSH